MKLAKFAARVLAAALAYLVGQVATGVTAPLFHFPTLALPEGSNPQHIFAVSAAMLPILVAGVLPIALGLQGRWLSRWSAVALFLYISLGLNTLIEAKIFSTVLAGNPLLASLNFVLPCALAAAVLTSRNNDVTSASAVSLARRGWAWRLVVTWLSFPLIYFLFGMIVSPFVVPFYRTSNALGLHIPSFGVIIETQLVRSFIFLLTSLGIARLWAKSSAQLFLALGLGYAMTLGIFPLAQAYFFPITLRVVHGLEIVCDSFAYAAVIALLFSAGRKTPVAIEKSAATAA